SPRRQRLSAVPSSQPSGQEQRYWAPGSPPSLWPCSSPQFIAARPQDSRAAISAPKDLHLTPPTCVLDEPTSRLHLQPPPSPRSPGSPAYSPAGAGPPPPAPPGTPPTLRGPPPPAPPGTPPTLRGPPPPAPPGTPPTLRGRVNGLHDTGEWAEVPRSG